MSLLKSPWVTLVELPVQNITGTWVNFPDQPDLTTLIDEQVNILAVELIPYTAMIMGPSGLANMPLADLQTAMLTLVNEDKKRVYNYPVLGLNRIYSTDSGEVVPHISDLQLFQNLSKIAWTKSGVQFTQVPGNQPSCILFNVHYEKLSTEKLKV